MWARANRANPGVQLAAKKLTHSTHDTKLGCGQLGADTPRDDPNISWQTTPVMSSQLAMFSLQ